MIKYCSMRDFIVSDSEDIISDGDDEDDQNQFPHPSSVGALHAPPIYHTPHIPTTGLMFWGSPDATTRPHTLYHQHTPLTERSTPSCATHTERKPLPFATPMYCAPLPLAPLTTPSSNKNFPRFKSQMIEELFQVFNKSVFDEKVILIFDVKSKT